MLVGNGGHGIGATIDFLAVRTWLIEECESAKVLRSIPSDPLVSGAAIDLGGQIVFLSSGIPRGSPKL